MITIQISACCISDVGRKRSTNEDVCWSSEENQVFLVADGVGGANSGDVASGLFRDTAQTLFAGDDTSLSASPDQDVRNCFITAHSKIQENVIANPDNHGMGCTAELLVLTNNVAILGHIGDSRSYLFRKGVFSQLTRDHTFVGEEVEAGNMSKQEARTHHLRNVIFKAVGISEEIDPDIISLPCKDGDVLLLCTDGLTDMVEDESITKILATDSLSIQQKVVKLVELANRNGGKDNIAVLLVKISK